MTAFSVLTTSMVLTLRLTNRSKTTLQRHYQLNTKSRAKALENLCALSCGIFRTASERIAKYYSKAHLNLNYTSFEFLLTKFKVQHCRRRAAYLFPHDQKAFISISLFGAFFPSLSDCIF